MENEKLLQEILENQKKQLLVLENLLKQQEKNDKKYNEYLDEQQKSNEEYRKSLETTSEKYTKNEEERAKEHEAYMHNTVVSRITNYVRMVSSLCLLSLVIYIVIYGVGVKN